MYKKLRFYVRFTTALIAKYYLAIILGLTLGIAGFYGFPKFINLIPRFRPTQRIAFVGRFTFSDLPLSIQQKVSIGLTTIGENGLPVPGIANSWVATDSGKTYIFTLNPTITWHDGTKIKSSDIKYRFRDAMVEYPDPSRIVFKLRDPFAPLPSVVSRPIFKTLPAIKPFRPTRYLGVGNYLIAQIHHNGNFIDLLTLKPTDQKSDLPIIKYQFYTTPQQARTALKLGLVDTIEDLPELADLEKWPNIHINEHPLENRYVAIFFNTQDPWLSGQSGKNLRMAMAYSLAKDRWPNRSIGPIPTSSWAFNPDIKKFDQDLAKSRDLLKKVEKIPDQITLTTVPTYLSVAEQVKSDWEKIGLHVTLVVKQDIPSEFQALIIAQAISSDPDQYNLWHSTQGPTNLSNLKNPRIDKLLEDGRKTLDLKTRKEIYFDFQKYLLEDVPVIFLYYPISYTIKKN